MTLYAVIQTMRRSVILLVILSLLSMAGYRPVNAQADGRPPVQIITGTLDQGQTIRYLLSDRSAGDVLYLYADSVSGNLDPFIGISMGDVTPAEIDTEITAVLDAALARDDDPVNALMESASAQFLASSDDDGAGYDASLTFTVPRDGDYALLLRSSYANPSFGAFELLVGVNAPEILTGTATPTGDRIAVIDQETHLTAASVQQITDTVSAQTGLNAYTLEPLAQGDTLYVYLEITAGDLRPLLVLQDFSGKFIRIANNTDDEPIITLEYPVSEDSRRYQLTVLPRSSELQASAEYRLLIGVNDPQVLTGTADITERPVIDAPIAVTVWLEVDQISGVDQREENFSIVGSLNMTWQDPLRAFRRDVCGCDQQAYLGDDFAGFTSPGDDITWPEYTFFNQQGRRETQTRGAIVSSNGTVQYTERFTVILQAPDFDFRLFPFDAQVFYVRLELLLDENHYTIVPDIERTVLGDQLGEEEYIFRAPTATVTSEQGVSRLSLRFEADRNVTYYIFRLLLPIVLIIVVTWVTFFLGDYVKRIDVAGSNLLVFVAFNFTVSGDLPRLGYLTLLDTVLISTFVVTSLILVLNVYLQRLRNNDREAQAKRIDRVAIWAYPLGFFALTALLIVFFVAVIA